MLIRTVGAIEPLPICNGIQLQITSRMVIENKKPRQVLSKCECDRHQVMWCQFVRPKANKLEIETKAMEIITTQLR